MFTKIRAGKFFSNFLIYAFLIGIAAFTVLPFIWMVSTSTKPPDQIFTSPPIFISSQANLSAYEYMFKNYHLERIVANSFTIAATYALGSVIFCAMGGFGFALYKFPGRNFLFSFLLATMIVPGAVTMVPLYFIMQKFGWINTFLPLIVPGLANAFGIIYMRQYISTISPELLDAARIDGASELGIFTNIILPISMPAIVSLGLIFFMGQWNSFLEPLIYLKSPSNFTLPLVIQSLVGPVGKTLWAAYMATSVVSVVPLLIIFLLFQRRFMEGIMSGAVKG
jgi:ABC-type glycerol-3-phosphate transport system permease component